MTAEKADVVAALGEVFREHGFEGASLARISARTGLGKGSLYHFFPKGKEDMARAVIGMIGDWFETEIFAPLDQAADPSPAIMTSLDAVESYFRSGRRVCLIGAFALADTRDRFAREVAAYFHRWHGALANALHRAGLPTETSNALAEELLAAIQGGLVLARALDEPETFTRIAKRWRARLADAIAVV